ncbi:glycoside hydrolase superfamily [Fusarium solani]|uniref:beta-glucosidase n=1 Tax=Fusarium solani TaxID=169388 RepID=A0A9P9KYV3_FUSSL|nr:glycoside hydrolase superfamily [Fusarium solani]KAH7270942.1 glycoside hydrolase superfamily [Fusarium solani]
MFLINVENAIEQLTLEEKVKLLAGQDTWGTWANDRVGIPRITTSDGPHGVRGTSFFNGPRGMLLPSATAMGATFDPELIYAAGELLAAEAKEKKCHVLLAPTVCIQRSPLLGRGFEAFAEDPWLSGTIASAYVNGVQSHGVACSIKHFAAHDQSSMAVEDDVRASERTLREMHLLPFQLAVKNASPWAFMMAYNKINGVHATENSWLINQVLRQDWGWDGLVMSDWFGTYSTSESLNAGMDLEMPGPSRWRGDLLSWAVMSDKVKKPTVDASVRNLLKLINKVQPWKDDAPKEVGDTQHKRDLCRKVANEAIVLLKNEHEVLPLNPNKRQTYGLIGPAVENPAISGGGSADLTPHYVSRPLEAIIDVVGSENVKAAIGCQAHLFTPQLSKDISVPNSPEPGYLVSWYKEDPILNPAAEPVASVTTVQAQMYFADNLPEAVPKTYWLQAKTIYTAPKSCTIELGLCVLGKGKLFVDGQEKVDLYTSQPEKTLQTPMFDQASMEVTAEIEVQQGKQYEILVYLKNEAAVAGVGALNCGGLRIGCCEKVDPASALVEAVKLASEVDVPIVIAGLNSDFESEALDRKSLDLPPAVDKLIAAVVKANKNTVVVTQSGCPILMPWLDDTPTLVHAWFGGQETGNAIADVLFGKTNPSGRLSLTFPKRLEDTPAFLTFGKGEREIHYGEGVFVGYRYYEKLWNPPLFYFGFGLSYSQFEYSNLQAPEKVNLFEAGSFDVSVDVTNTSSRGGHEVVQLYVADKTSTAPRPLKELKAFKKVWIDAGKSQKVTISLDKYALSFWSEVECKWLAEAGVFEFIIARSSDPKDGLLREEIELVKNFTWNGL